MPADTWNLFDQFFDDKNEGVHTFASDTLKVALTNTAPTTATDAVLADITQITAQNGYSSGGTALSSVTSTQTSGTYTLDAATVTFTASGGSFGPFRYAVLYNDTPVSPADPLIGWLDYGSSVSVNDGETLSITLASGIFTEASA